MLPKLKTIPEVIDQVTKAEDALKPFVGGTTKPFFRPPYGNAHERERNAIGTAGFTLDMMWDVTTDDYLPISRAAPRPMSSFSRCSARCGPAPSSSCT